MSENLAISARTTRLNSLILGRLEALKNPQKEICAGINCLMPCSYFTMNAARMQSKRKANTFRISEFPIPDRPIVRETKQLRVNFEDFDVKTQIGSGYFGEVHVSLK
jgi:hypothetical protein